MISAPMPLVRNLATVLRPEPARVVLRPYVPADNRVPGARETHVERILARVRGLDANTLSVELARVVGSLSDRHRDVEGLLERRFRELAGLSLGDAAHSRAQMLLAGAYFVEEISFEAAALFNPSIVLHPDQYGVPAGAVRVLLSLRAVGEGHVSSIVFRSGMFTDAGELVIDAPSPWAASPQIALVPGRAPDDPDVRLGFGTLRDLSEAVIFPVTYRQRHGIEDLRLVRFVEDDGRVAYIGTYTAFSGEAIRQELLRTTDFLSYELRALHGALSVTKGMALFPRRIGGDYAMLGRQDHENIWLLRSGDLCRWDRGALLVSPRWPWEFVQIGNSSPPIEIEEGWLCILHGVGPVRNYCLGAFLLDKQDPSKLIARSTEPLIRPSTGTRDGYVPNVIYSCGGLVLGRRLLLPYGVADSFTAFAAVDVDALLRTMR